MAVEYDRQQDHVSLMHGRTRVETRWPSLTHTERLAPRHFHIFDPSSYLSETGMRIKLLLLCNLLYMKYPEADTLLSSQDHNRQQSTVSFNLKRCRWQQVVGGKVSSVGF